MALMENKSVLLETSGSHALITVNRPESLNALNIDVLQGLMMTFDELSRMDSVLTVVITGAGEKAFVAGADIATMNQLGPRAISDYVELGQRVMRTVETFKRPVIAQLNGFALGGGFELALSCDLIIASDKARVGQPEVNLGIIPGFGGTQRLIQRAGVGAARRLVYTGDIITAQDALSLGVIDQVVEGEKLSETVQVLCDKIAQKGPLAVSGAKEVIRQSQEAVLLSGLRIEAEKFLSLFTSRDREEGMTAFMQKRPPSFKGR